MNMKNILKVIFLFVLIISIFTVYSLFVEENEPTVTNNISKSAEEPSKLNQSVLNKIKEEIKREQELEEGLENSSK